MAERTPNTNTIRHAWAQGHPFPLTTDVDERYAEFDRWLAAHDVEVRAETLRGAAEAVHSEARWQQEQVMRGAVMKSGAETAVERLLVVEQLLRQQASHFDQEGQVER